MQSQSSIIKNLQKKIQDSPIGVQVNGISFQENRFLISLEPSAYQNQILKNDIEKMIHQSGLTCEITFLASSQKKETRPKPQKTKLDNIQHVIAIASGKGGVGKSTVAVNIAYALHQLGRRVGIVDADIYGPSIPQMIGHFDKPSSSDGKLMQPIVHEGVGCMSMGFLMPKHQPAIWRGPMVMKAVRQMIEDVAWGTLDYLIIDMPPGTGDAHLTLMKSFELTGAVVVSTPQEIAVIDAVKAMEMFKTVDIPVLGVIENMATFHCPNCQHETHVFGQNGAEKMAINYKSKLLGKLPLMENIRQSGDESHPAVLSEPAGTAAQLFRDMASRVEFQIRLLDQNEKSAEPQKVESI